MPVGYRFSHSFHLVIRLSLGVVSPPQPWRHGGHGDARRSDGALRTTNRQILAFLAGFLASCSALISRIRDNPWAIVHIDGPLINTDATDFRCRNAGSIDKFGCGWAAPWPPCLRG